MEKIDRYHIKNPKPGDLIVNVFDGDGRKKKQPLYLILDIIKDESGCSRAKIICVDGKRYQDAIFPIMQHHGKILNNYIRLFDSYDNF